MNKILILTCEEDIHTDAVVKHIQQLDRDCVRLDREGYGHEWVVSAMLSKGKNKIVISTKDKDFLSSEFNSIWFRREFTSDSARVNSSDVADYINVQTSIHVNSIFRELSRSVRSMNPPSSNWLASSKLTQLNVATAHGFAVPRTFQGGSPKLAHSYLQGCDGTSKVVIKALEAIHLKTNGSVKAHYTSIFKLRGLAELSSVRDCPVVLQDFVSKDVEIRATLVGQDIFAASIDTSTASEAAKVDWRHYDWANTKYFRIRLPELVKSRLLKVAEDLGLVYGAFDLIKSKDGTFYFLEVNSQGQWLWIEDLTDMRITESIARWLCGER